MTVSKALHSLLQAGRRFSGSYGSGFANHLPMALVALEGLGGDERRLREFAAFYEKRLRPTTESDQAVLRGDWRNALGREEWEMAVRDTIADALAKRGPAGVLAELLPELTRGIGSAAFHGLIRTAYAVESGDDTDLPEALCYWIVTYGELRPPAEIGAFATAAAAFDAMHLDGRFGNVQPSRSIDAGMSAAAGMPAFIEYCGPVRDLDLAQLARMAVLIYLASADFAALHLVTTCHATRVLLPYLGRNALDHLLIAMLAVYATIGRPPLDTQPEATGPAADREALAARAVTSNDDHDLKLVYSALREGNVYRWGLHEAAAWLRLSRSQT